MVVDQCRCTHPPDRAKLLDRPAHFQVVAFFHGYDQAALGGGGVNFNTGQLFQLHARMRRPLWLDVDQQARNVHLGNGNGDTPVQVGCH